MAWHWFALLVLVIAIPFDWAMHEQFNILRAVLSPRREAIPYRLPDAKRLALLSTMGGGMVYVYARHDVQLGYASAFTILAGIGYVAFVAWTILRD